MRRSRRPGALLWPTAWAAGRPATWPRPPSCIAWWRVGVLPSADGGGPAPSRIREANWDLRASCRARRGAARAWRRPSPGLFVSHDRRAASRAHRRLARLPAARRCAHAARRETTRSCRPSSTTASIAAEDAASHPRRNLITASLAALRTTPPRRGDREPSAGRPLAAVQRRGHRLPARCTTDARPGRSRRSPEAAARPLVALGAGSRQPGQRRPRSSATSSRVAPADVARRIDAEPTFDGAAGRPVPRRARLGVGAGSAARRADDHHLGVERRGGVGPRRSRSGWPSRTQYS